MAYEHIRHTRRQEIRYNSSGAENRLAYRFTLGGKEKGAATTGNVALFNSSGTTILTSTTLTAEAAPSSIFYVDVSTSTSATAFALGEGYQAKFAITYEGETYNDRQFFDIVRNPLTINVSDDDLEAYESDLSQFKAPGQSDWSRKIQLGVDYVHRRLRQKSTQDGFGRPALLIGSGQVETLAILRTLEAIFRDIEGREDKVLQYETLAGYEEEAVLSSLAYDRSDSENPGDKEEENFTGITLTR